MKVYCKDCKHFYYYHGDPLKGSCKEAIEITEDSYFTTSTRKELPEEMNYDNQCKLYEKREK